MKMSKYTTQLRYICEVEAGYTESQPYSKVNEIVKAAAPENLQLRRLAYL